MGDYYRLGRLCPFLTRLGSICLSRNGQILPSHPYPEMSSRRRGRRVGVEEGRREHGGTQWHMRHVCSRLGGGEEADWRGDVGCTAGGCRIRGNKQAYSTQCSQVVSHPSTNWA